MNTDFRRTGLAGQALFFILVLLGALVLWHGPAVWTGQVFCGRDLYDYFLPLREYQRSHGWFTAWQDGTFSGRPLAADIQSGLFYPPNWLHLSGLAPERIVTLLTTAHLLFGGLGFCLFLMPRFGRVPALLAGLLWTCGGYQVLRLASGIFVFTEAFAWVPWMWWAAERQALRRGPGLCWTGALALFGAMQLATGAVQIVQITWCGLALWTAGRLVAPEGESRGAIAGGFLAAGALALLACAPSLFAALQFQRDSWPRGTGDPWAFLADGSLHPRVLWTWLFPEMYASGNSEELYWGSSAGFTETNIYLGLAAPGLALFALLRGTKRAVATELPAPVEDRRWLASLAALALLAFLIALGEHGPLFRPLTRFVPTFDYFRVPARWLLWTVAAVCVLAAWGLSEILSAAQEESKRDALRWWLAGAGTVLMIAIVARVKSQEMLVDLGVGNVLMRYPLEAVGPRAELLEAPVAAMEWAAMVAGAALALGLLHLLGKIPRRAFLVLLLGLALADLRRFWMPFTEPMPTDIPAAAIPTEAPYHRIAAGAFREHFYPETPLVAFAREASAEGRLHYNDSLISYYYDQNQREFLMERPLANDLRVTRGYQQIHLRSYVEDYFASFGAPEDGNAGAFLPQYEIRDRRFLDAYNVRWFLAYEADDMDATLRGLGLGEKRAVGDSGLQAWPNPGARGWAWLSAAEEFLDAAPDPGLGTLSLRTHEGSLREGTATVSGPAWLHFSAPDAAGWTLTAIGPGGASAEPATSRSIHLPAAGEWTFRREYRSPAFRPSSLVLALLSVGLALALAAMGWKHRERA